MSKAYLLQDGIERMKEQWPTLFTIEKRILGDDWLKEELILQSYEKIKTTSGMTHDC